MSEHLGRYIPAHDLKSGRIGRMIIIPADTEDIHSAAMDRLRKGKNGKDEHLYYVGDGDEGHCVDQNSVFKRHFKADTLISQRNVIFIAVSKFHHARATKYKIFGTTLVKTM